MSYRTVTAGSDLVGFTERLLKEPASTGRELGGLTLYGASEQFSTLSYLCMEFVQRASEQGSDRPARLALFLPRGCGKSTVARLMVNEFAARGREARRVEGRRGESWGELTRARISASDILIVDDLPSDPGHRRQQLSRLSSLPCSVLVLTDPMFRHDEGLVGTFESFAIAEIGERLEDKACWLVGSILEELLAIGEPMDAASAFLRRLPAPTLAVLIQMPTTDWPSNVASLAKAIAELRLSLPDDPSVGADPISVTQAFLAAVVPARQGRAGYRVWVEGETDRNILSLAIRLGQERFGIDCGEGIEILAVGEGREGGASKALEIFQREATQRHCDLFLFDSDDDGRRAADQLGHLNQAVMLLPKEFLRQNETTDGHVVIEIEDILSIDCLDRFYIDHPALTPEYEGLYYKQPVRRRLVVRGPDKEELGRWLDVNATFEDMERVFWVVSDIRRHFGLRRPQASRDLRRWQSELCGGSHPSGSLGRRPLPWWYIVM